MGIEEHIGDYGVAVAVIIGAVLIVRALAASGVSAMQLWRDAAKERNSIDQRRNEVDEIVARSLRAVVEGVERLTDKQTEAINSLDGMRREVQIAHGGQADQLSTIIAKIEDVPVAVRNALVDDFEKVGRSLSELRTQNDQQSRQLDIALQDWAQTGARLAALIVKPSIDSGREIVDMAHEVMRATGEHLAVKRGTGPLKDSAEPGETKLDKAASAAEGTQG